MAFHPDSAFVLKATRAIRELEDLVTTHERGNHRYERICEDLTAVLKRFLYGDHCSLCNGRAKLPPIISEVQCGDECRSIVEQRKTELEQRVSEAVAEAQYGNAG